MRVGSEDSLPAGYGRSREGLWMEESGREMEKIRKKKGVGKGR